MNKYVQRFWERVTKGDKCWDWNHSLTHKGYGAFYAIYDDQTWWRAHRFSWRIHNGKIPDGMQVLHRCDNPKCVNPDHLWLGTDADNRADRIHKGRQTKGKRIPTAKLSREAVRMIRRSPLNNTQMAKKLGMHNSTISRIRLRKYWKYVD